MDRAYSVLEIRAVKDDERVIEGIASTPTPDRMDDVVEPMGAEYSTPMPLLWQHFHDQPVGEVEFARPTKAGIPFRARLIHPDQVESETLKERLRLAWDSVKQKLVRAVSIGFRPIEHSILETGGWRFLRWEWLELSLVTIPANAEATITAIKSFDREALARHGQQRDASETRTVRSSAAQVSGERTSTRKQGGVPMPKTIAEQISAFDSTRQTKAARMAEIMAAAAESGETLDQEQADEYDRLKGEVKSVDDHLARLREMETMNVSRAVAVQGQNQDQGGQARGGVSVQVRGDNIPKGIRMTRMALAKAWAVKNNAPAYQFAKQWTDTPEVERVLRAAVDPMTSTHATAAGPLVEETNMASEFVDVLRPLTIIGRIPGLRRVPFNIKIPRGVTDPSVGWVGEASSKPVSAMAFDNITLLYHKVAGIVPMTEELWRFSNPDVEMLIRDALASQIAYRTDRDFLDPTKAEETGVSPASIIYGVNPIASTGTTADALRDDLGSLLAAYAAANMSFSGIVLVMTAQQAVKISLMRNTLGQREFDGLGVNGGTLEGIPVITSENIVGQGGSPTDGTPIIAINAPEILIAEGGVEVDASREASIQMNTAPDSPETTSTVLVSAFQRNLILIKAEEFITWKARRTGAAQWISYAKYQ